VPFGLSRCNDPDRCERLIQAILGLAPVPARAEFERNPILGLASKLHADPSGADFLFVLERFARNSPTFYVFSPMPSLGQFTTALD